MYARKLLLSINVYVFLLSHVCEGHIKKISFASFFYSLLWLFQKAVSIGPACFPVGRGRSLVKTCSGLWIFSFTPCYVLDACPLRLCDVFFPSLFLKVFVRLFGLGILLTCSRSCPVLRFRACFALAVCGVLCIQAPQFPGDVSSVSSVLLLRRICLC